MQDKRGIIISVVNHKGGVGKTAVTVNLADCLGRLGKTVLVVDNDAQSNSTALLFPDLKMAGCMYDLLDPETQNLSVADLIYPTNYSNVFILPNVDDTSAIEGKLIMAAPHSLMTLRTTLRKYAAENYDVTIIDNPPNMGSFVYCSLLASDAVIVPIKAGSTFSLRGLAAALSRIDEVRNQTDGNPDLRFLRLLINMMDKRTTISKSISAQLYSMFPGNQIFGTVIPINTAIEKAEEHNQSVSKFDPAAPASRAFKELARELVAIIDEVEVNGVADGRA